MLAAFVYANPRSELLAEIAAGRAPDTTLLGQNHLPALGIDTVVHEPKVRRRQRQRGLVHRLTWNVRELTLPWELGKADVAVTPLANVFPLAAKARGRPKVLLLNFGLLTTWRRASGPRRRLLKTALEACGAVACLGSEQHARLVSETRLSAGRARIVEIGVDERFFRPEPRPTDGYVLAVGKDLARDYATLARAAEQLDRRVRIVIHPRNLAGLRLPGNVEVLHGVSWEQLRDLYAGAACVALPLRRPDYPFGTEGSGLTALLEAMAAARPVVLTDRAVFSDYVEPGESCLAVPPEDHDALRAALRRVLEDVPLAERLGARSRTLVEERFTTRHLAERLAALIREVGASPAEQGLSTLPPP